MGRIGPFAGEVRVPVRDQAPYSMRVRGFFVLEDDMEKGLVQIYTGSGKGKTTAAVGLAVRALGQGMRVLLARFLKPVDPPSGEVLFLDGVPGVEVLSSGIGILAGSADAAEVGRSIRETFEQVRSRSADFDLVILDEINNAVHRGHLPVSDLLQLLDNRPQGVEFVLTGRNVHTEVLDRAHLVTRFEKVRHPFDEGIDARRGIEY